MDGEGNSPLRRRGYRRCIPQYRSPRLTIHGTRYRLFLIPVLNSSEGYTMKFVLASFALLLAWSVPALAQEKDNHGQAQRGEQQRGSSRDVGGGQVPSHGP